MVAEPPRSTAGLLIWGNQVIEPSALAHDLLPHINADSTSRPGTIDESLATYLAAPDKPEDVAEDATADDDIVKMIWRTRAIINNFGFTVKDLVDNQDRSVGCLNITLRSISDCANKMEERFLFFCI